MKQFAPPNPNNTTGPASSTDNAIARWDGTTGKVLQDSAVIVDDSGNVFIGAGQLLDIANNSQGFQMMAESQSSFYVTLTFRATGITSDRRLIFQLADANRLITLSGDPILDDWFNQSVKTTAAPQHDGLGLGVAGASGKLSVTKTITAAGTTGNQTINKLAGTVNIAAAGTSIVITNSLVDANSIVLAVLRTNDATGRIIDVVPASGSFTIHVVPPAGEISIGFFVIS